MIFNWKYFESLNNEEQFEYLSERARQFYGVKRKKDWYSDEKTQREKTREYLLDQIDNAIETNNRLAWRYYNGDEDQYVMSDEVYDDDLKCIEVLIDYVSRNYKDIEVQERFDKSPTFFVGGHDYPKKGRDEYKHYPPMLSIKNARTIEELNDFLNQNYKVDDDKTTLYKSMESFIVSPKVDGVACSIVYYDGKLSYAATRGDGNKGLDITQHVLEIKNVPKVIDYSEEYDQNPFEVRGEIYMTRSSFDYVNETEKEKAEAEGKKFTPFANPRNLVAGTLNNLNYKLAGERELQFIAHSPSFCSESYKNYLRVFLEKYKDKNFRVVDFVEFKPKKGQPWYFDIKRSKFLPVEDLYKIIDDMWNNIVKKLPYDCDGIVIAVNNRNIVYKLSNDKKYQAGSIACKYMLDTATRTRLIKIEYTVGKTGKITPVAWFEPVEIAGSVVQKATLGSKETMESLDLYENDIIQVSKAGGIIPHIDKAIPELRSSDQKFVFPEICPVCGTKLESFGKKISFCPACKQE